MASHSNPATAADQAESIAVSAALLALSASGRWPLKRRIISRPVGVRPITGPATDGSPASGVLDGDQLQSAQQVAALGPAAEASDDVVAIDEEQFHVVGRHRRVAHEQDIVGVGAAEPAARGVRHRADPMGRRWAGVDGRHHVGTEDFAGDGQSVGPHAVDDPLVAGQDRCSVALDGAAHRPRVETRERQA